MVHRKQAWSRANRRERLKKKFLSRGQASKLLQVDSMNFRRLCILKGIYPRAIAKSKQKESGSTKQFYLAKEIKWLVHDQMAARIFDYDSWTKKMKRAKATRDKEAMRRLQRNDVKPQYTLAATIKERYPYFVDALKDVDDAMSMVSLYAFLAPEVKSETTIEFHHSHTTGLQERSKSIVDEWMAYIVKAKALSKSFISVKGYYYEAVVNGQRIRWLMPHEYASKFPPGIQQYVLLSFLEFHLEMMKFILFKLNRMLEQDVQARIEAEDLGAEENAEELRGVEGMGKAGAPAQESEHTKVGTLFEKFVFYISREVPRKHATFVINACGGRVVNEMVSTVTHYVVDRPSLQPGHAKVPGVEYVQPQYVFDCMNARLVLPVQGYRMGEDLPAHVSPFTVSLTMDPRDLKAIDDDRKMHPKMLNYVPNRVHEIRKLHDPSYVPLDPTNEVDLDGSSSGEEDVHDPALDDLEEVSLSDDEEFRAARKTAAWEDEEVKEHPERSAVSALKVKKQRELNMANQPTPDGVAARRAQMAKNLEKKKVTETTEQRLKRKKGKAADEERARQKMQLQVMRKKAGRYFKMVSGAQNSVKKKEKVLERKAKMLEAGQMKVSEDGATFQSAKKKRDDDGSGEPSKKSRKSEAKMNKAKNPYSKLPKWVQ